MPAVASVSRGVRVAKAFIEKFLNDRQLRKEIAALGPKPTDEEAVLAKLTSFAAARGFVFTADDYEEAAQDYLDTRYGAVDAASTCCCHTSPSSSSSLPKSYAEGDGEE